jgi:hypothetical protein
MELRMGSMKIWALRKMELRMGSISMKCMAEGFPKHRAPSFFFFALYILVLYWAKKIMFVNMQ